ncbi:MAG: thiamine/thiamine pyrophosphate ABC transporter permease ThiP [Boseongicola sp.]
MARRAQPLGVGGRLGIAVAAAVPLLVAATSLAVITAAEGGRGITTADWAAIRFTIWQAALSAGLSVALAIPVARALARRRFRGHGILITLLGAPFLLPVIVAIFGLLAVFGRNGILNSLLEMLGLAPVSIYGAHGVIFAHVFFNLPLATRLILQGWQSIPGERFRLAATLDMGSLAIARHLELPMLKRIIPGALLIIFVVCTTSFAVALTLGGGPRATTVELAIYQALRFEFDLSRAAFLSVIQLGITGVAAFIALKFATTPQFGPGLDRAVRRWDAQGLGVRVMDFVLIAAAALFLLLPVASVLIGGLPRVAQLPDSVWVATSRSLAVAFASTVLVVVSALCMAIAATRVGPKGRYVEGAGLMAIAASPLVLGTGLFILVFPFIDPSRLALPVTALVNAVVTLPFVLRVLLPAMQTIEDDYGRLADSLDIRSVARLRLVTLPRLRRPLGFAAGIAAALSMGDLGVITLFADPETATLPLQIYRLMGAYRMDDAAGATTLLLIISFSLFWVLDRGLGRHAQD